MSEACCAERTGINGLRWHKRRDSPPCDRAVAEGKKGYAAKRERTKQIRGTLKWIPGSSILVEEIEEL